MKTTLIVLFLVLGLAAGYLLYKQQHCGCDDEQTFEPKRNGSKVNDETVAKMGEA